MTDMQEWHQGLELQPVTADKRCKINISTKLKKSMETNSIFKHPVASL
jgi:hypothetical protein